MTEFKWPVWPELPFLLLFLLIVVLASVFLLAAVEDEGMQGGQSLEADSVEARTSQGRAVAPNQSTGE